MTWVISLADAHMVAAERFERMHYSAPTKCRAKKMPKGYKQIMANIEGKLFVAPESLANNRQWYEFFSKNTRATHVETFCKHVFRNDEGQPCVVISYPRAGKKVKCYDLDSGRIFTLGFGEVMTAEKVRNTEENDLQCGTILASDYCDEATDICNILFP